MSTSTPKHRRRWAILAVAGVAVLAITATVAPVEAKTVYPPCNSITREDYMPADGSSPVYTRFVPSIEGKGNPFDCLLGERNSGDLVLYLQNVMRFSYLMDLEQDGDYGPETTIAMEHFQTAMGGMVPDGVYGPITKNKMFFPTFVIGQYELFNDKTPVSAAVYDRDGNEHWHFVELGDSGEPLILWDLAVPLLYS